MDSNSDVSSRKTLEMGKTTLMLWRAALELAEPALARCSQRSCAWPRPSWASGWSRGGRAQLPGQPVGSPLREGKWGLGLPSLHLSRERWREEVHWSPPGRGLDFPHLSIPKGKRWRKEAGMQAAQWCWVGCILSRPVIHLRGAQGHGSWLSMEGGKGHSVSRPDPNVTVIPMSGLEQQHAALRDGNTQSITAS